jgi:hypothetical protein
MNIEVLEDMEINKESTVCLMLVKSFKFRIWLFKEQMMQQLKWRNSIC